MTTELSFLLDLLLNQRLPKLAKDLVAARIKEVEETLSKGYPVPAHAQGVRQQMLSPAVANQAPSMQAIMARHPDLVPQPQEPGPVAVVAQTAATAAAMLSRQEAIAAAGKGQANASGGKRKF